MSTSNSDIRIVPVGPRRGCSASGAGSASGASGCGVVRTCDAMVTREAGATVDIKRVPELVPVEVAKASHYKVDQVAPVAKIDDLATSR